MSEHVVAGSELPYMMVGKAWHADVAPLVMGTGRRGLGFSLGRFHQHPHV